MQNYSYPAPSVTIPPGGATAANQVLEIAALDSLDSKTTTVDTNNVHVTASVLPPNAATESTLADVSSSVASIDSQIVAKLAGALVPAAFDEIALTYVPSGPGAGQVATATYKLATVTVKTLTLSYDGSDRLSGVVAS